MQPTINMSLKANFSPEPQEYYVALKIKKKRKENIM